MLQAEAVLRRLPGMLRRGNQRFGATGGGGWQEGNGMRLSGLRPGKGSPLRHKEQTPPWGDRKDSRPTTSAR